MNLSRYTKLTFLGFVFLHLFMMLPTKSTLVYSVGLNPKFTSKTGFVI